MPAFKDLVGKRFGRLIVIETVGKNHNRHFLWNCLCDCGQSKVVPGSQLVTNKVASCGCYRKDVATNTGYMHGIKNLPKGKGKNRVHPEQNFWTIYYNSYKTDAIKRNYSWNLTIDHVKNLASRNCYYCDAKPVKCDKAKTAYLCLCRRHKTLPDLDFAESKVFYANGIDRKNNLLGYEIHNVVPCCGMCNVAKSDSSMEEWEDWQMRLMNHKKRNTPDVK